MRSVVDKILPLGATDYLVEPGINSKIPNNRSLSLSNISYSIGNRNARWGKIL